jgi:uncharacterized protein YecE (DUF72 family)
VFEFRHGSWYCEDTFELLGQYGAGFCIHDMPDKESPRVVTADIIYIRFHSSTCRYSGSYSKSALQSWARWLKQQAKEARSIYVYFNNDISGHAVRNTKTLKEQFE